MADLLVDVSTQSCSKENIADEKESNSTIDHRLNNDDQLTSAVETGSAMADLLTVDFTVSSPSAIDDSNPDFNPTQTDETKVNDVPIETTSTNTTTSTVNCSSPQVCDHFQLVERLHQQLDQLLNEKEEMSKRLKQTQSDLDECEQLMHERQDRLNRLNEIESTNTKLKALAIKMKRELAETKESEIKLKEELRSLQKDKERVQSAHHLLIKNFQNLQTEHDRLQDECEQIKKSLKLFESDLATSVKELTIKKDEQESIRLMNESLIKKIGQLEGKLTNEQSSAKELNSRIIVLKNRLDEERRKSQKASDLEKANEQLNQTLAQCRKEIADLTDQCQNLRQQEQRWQSIEREYVELNAKFADTEQQLHDLQQEYERLHNSSQTSAEQSEQARAQCEQALETLAELRIQHEQLRIELQDSQREYQRRLDEKAELLSLAEEELKQKDAQFNAYKLKVAKVLNEQRMSIDCRVQADQVMQLQGQIQNLTRQLNEMQSELRSEKEHKLSLDATIRELREENLIIDSLRDKIAQLDLENEHLKSINRDVEYKHVVERSELERKMNEMESLIKLINQDHQNELIRYKNQLDALQQVDNMSTKCSSPSTSERNLIANSQQQPTSSSPLPPPPPPSSSPSSPPPPPSSSPPFANNQSTVNTDCIHLHLSNNSDNNVDLDNSSESGSTSVVHQQQHKQRLSLSSLPSNYVNPLAEILNSTTTTTTIGKQASGLSSTEHQDRIKQINELFEESEANNLLLTEQNRVLKEEIRRLQRTIERTEIAENLEYLKNILIKFVNVENNTTTASEKKQLVPVLKTLLKLSKEEESKLQNFASFLANLNQKQQLPPSTSSSSSSPSSSSSSGSVQPNGQQRTQQNGTTSGNWSSYIWNGFS